MHNSNIFIPAMTSNANKLLRDYSLARHISRFFLLMISAQAGNLNPFEVAVVSGHLLVSLRSTKEMAMDKEKKEGRVPPNSN